MVHLEGVQAVDNRVQDCVSVLQMVEERQLFERHFNETHVLVIVLEDALLDVLQDLRVLQHDLIEVLLLELANGAVLESDD